ncbi:MAG: hypothetical protein M1820_004181 [Bogoriella megaspora]|nr:MAG: hypothetical protein M1820_004181 [Bogoriella megaspora]
MTTKPPIRLTVLISGSGTNLQALIDATTSSPPLLPNTTIVRVICNHGSAYGLQRAMKASIPTHYHSLLPYKKLHPDPSVPVVSSTTSRNAPTTPAARAAYDTKLASLVLADKPDIVIMAGFMLIVSSSFLTPLREASPKVWCINLHPSLPGGYVGAHGIHDAWTRFQEGTLEGGRTGVMVHEVVEEVDRGEAVVWREIEMREGETEGEFEERVHGVEHEIVVEAVRVVGERVWRERRGEEV